MERVILWDFDGTLAHRPGWSACLVETLDEAAPGGAGGGSRTTRAGALRGFLVRLDRLSGGRAGARAVTGCGAAARDPLEPLPELPAIVAGLGLGRLFDLVLTSAAIGYEKPHPEAFAHARRRCGEPRQLWMVGDNPDADVAGADAAGIPSVLVRKAGGAADLDEAATVILDGGSVAHAAR